MIRITLNLARRPAENLRRVRLVWGGSLAVLLALLIGLSTVALIGWRDTRPIQAQTDAVRDQIAPLLADRARAQAPLADPQIRAALNQSEFFNRLIDTKSISWTQLFERLEEITPPEVELVSLRPLERNGADAVDIRFASDTLPPAIDFVHQLETSGDFAQAQVQRETEANPSTTPIGRGGEAPPPRFQLEVTALYRPQPETQPETKPAAKPTAKVDAKGGQ